MGKTTWRTAQIVPTTITARHNIAWTSLWLITERHPQVLSANNTPRNLAIHGPILCPENPRAEVETETGSAASEAEAVPLSTRTVEHNDVPAPFPPAAADSGRGLSRFPPERHHLFGPGAAQENPPFPGRASGNQNRLRLQFFIPNPHPYDTITVWLRDPGGELSAHSAAPEGRPQTGVITPDRNAKNRFEPRGGPSSEYENPPGAWKRVQNPPPWNPS